MIRKLRIRFVLVAMIAFFLVIALMGSLVNIINYIMVAQRNDETIDYIYEYDELGPRFDDRGGRNDFGGHGGPDDMGGRNDLGDQPLLRTRSQEQRRGHEDL